MMVAPIDGSVQRGQRGPERNGEYRGAHGHENHAPQKAQPIPDIQVPRSLDRGGHRFIVIGLARMIIKCISGCMRSER
jgi:hypothetical protein